MKSYPIMPMVLESMMGTSGQSTALFSLFSGMRNRIGPGRKSIMTSRCYQDRSKYTPQSPQMKAYHPPTDERGFLIGFGTTHRARKQRQMARRQNL